ncbi:MAG: hypothetical protein LIP03_11935 [Bacteroidales bacterium]|nr:hypothetical protein [Bacteroidales bacterium]
MKLIRYACMAVACFCAVAMGSCGHDDDDTIIGPNSFGSYVITLQFTQTGLNQEGKVVTSVEYVDYKGNTVKDNVVPDEDGLYTLTTQAYTRVPASSTIKINQTLSSDFDYGQNYYSFGTTVSATLTSYDLSGNMMWTQTAQGGYNKSYITESEIKSIFPFNAKFQYSVDKTGSVSIAYSKE